MLGAGAMVAVHTTEPALVSAAPPTPAETIKVDYAPVEAFLKANCIECHGPTKQKGDITLHTYHDVDSVIKDRKVWQTVLEKIRAGEMPPKKKPRPDKAEQEVFLRTIDQIFYQYDMTHPLDPGQVTIRRLNRTEYDNTIRDLVGVDSQPAEDFPSDDVGQGFDNIGDVLSVSPVLMERYLSAADGIMNSAIPVDPAKPLDHYVDGRYMEPAINPSTIPQRQGRPLAPKNTLFSSYKVHDDGEYTIRYRVYPEQTASNQSKPKIDGKWKDADKAKGNAKPGTPTSSSAFPKAEEDLGVPGKLAPAGSDKAKDSAKPEGQAKAGATKAADKTDSKPDENKSAEGKPAEEKPAEVKPAEVAILVDKHELKTFEVTTTGDRRNPQTIEIKTHISPGEHRFELALHHGWENDPGRTLKVVHLQLIGPPDTRSASERMLLQCDENLSKHDQSRQVLKRFANRAYRRPATDAEVDHLVQFAEQAQSQGQTWRQSMSLAMQAVLISPKFLFRVELDNRPDSAGPHPIDEFQLASRLSYFLWSTMPDDELMGLAAKNQLTPHLDEQVRRMLKDPKAEALVDNFAIQWLQLRRLKNFSPDEEMFPAFNDRLRKDMLTETKMFVGSVFREDRSILDLIDADYTFLNPRLARFYGIGMDGKPLANSQSGQRGYRRNRDEDETFHRVQLPDHTRGGVLTEASVLCVTSNPTRTSPVKRGKFVLEQILGVPPPPPPPNVPQLEDVKPSANGATVHVSIRKRMEQHRADPNCANCHEHMDGIGFAFENFNAVGAFRANEDGLDIDPSGTMPDGESFRGAPALKALLKQRTDLFSRCLTKKMLIYATGRGIEYYDQRAIDNIVSALKQNDFKFSTLVTQIVKSEPFRMRRGKEQNPS
ncbi:MAG TPA: DUF1592 domain-containing protein [Tepidisphaeraceae bacterium]|nr:DUF1592 domain-containing protein [Tepidisphaeraceae bacterium]